MQDNRKNSRQYFENIVIWGRCQNSSMLFHVFFSASGFLISSVLASCKLDNYGAYLDPLKSELLKWDPL